MGVEGQTSYEIEFDTLKYVHEEERAERPPGRRPGLVREAIRSSASDRPRAALADATPGWRLITATRTTCGPRWRDRLYPSALPYSADAAVTANARESLRKYVAEWVLQKERFTPTKDRRCRIATCTSFTARASVRGASWVMPASSARTCIRTSGPYAHYTGDIATIRVALGSREEARRHSARIRLEGIRPQQPRRDRRRSGAADRLRAPGLDGR